MRPAVLAWMVSGVSNVGYLIAMLHPFATYCLLGLTAAIVPPKHEPPNRATSARSCSSPKPKSAKKPKAAANKAKEPATPSDPTLAMIGRVQKFYETTTDLKADFIQTYTRVALSRTTESRGTVALKKPGMMRWDYDRPEKKSFIADGQRLFIYEPEEEQVIVDSHFKATELSTSVSFLWGQGDLTKTFTVETLDTNNQTTTLELTPKSDATYRKLVLIVETPSGKVIESILHESSGNTNHFKFKNIATNKGLAADTFTFVPPPGIDVVHRP